MRRNVLVAAVFLFQAGLNAQTVAPKVPLKSPLVPFGICLQEMSAGEQVAFCQKNGFSGMGLGFVGPGNPEVKRFADLPDVQAGRFRIYSALWWSRADMNLADPLDKQLDDFLTQLARMKTALWIVSEGPRNDPATYEAMVKNLCEVARRCRSKKVPLVLYPHLGCVYETAEEGVTVLKDLSKRGFPEVRTSIHLCHELKAGNGGRIADVVKTVAPYLALASVSGGDTDARQKGGWETAIKPLGEGTYDPKPFLSALAANGYRGPIELHTYGLPNPTKDNHLARSLKWWKSVVL